MEKFLPYGIALLAILGYGSLPAFFKKLDQDLPTFLVIGISMILLGLMTLAAHFLVEPRTIPGKEAWGLLALAALINAVAFYAMLQAMSGMPVWHYQMMCLAFPVVSAFAAYFLLGEAFSVKLFIGLAIASVGIYWAVRPT